MKYSIREKFDYSVVMGFMDYIKEPKRIVERVLSITKSKAFFSFPADGGILAWQRKLRYKRRCDLFMYSIEELRELFADMNYKSIESERIGRDFFITIFMESQ